MKIVIAVALCIVSTIAEPPVDNRYLPPPQGFNAVPSQLYGAPGSAFRQTNALFRSPQPFRPRPSPQYGPPATQLSSQYGLPSRIQTAGPEYTAPNPSQLYGAPGFGLAGQLAHGGAFGTEASSRQYLPPGAGRARYSDDGSTGEPANYSFQYMVKDDQSGNDFGHRETRLGDRAEGLYYVLLPDGRKQTVQYEADQGGYKPRISYEDTGLALGAYNRNALGYDAYKTAGGPY